jgi:predicted MPP superfamily phosphohydrolase
MIKRLIIASFVAFVIASVGHFYLYLRLAVPISEEFSYWSGPIFVGLWALTFFGFPVLRILPSKWRSTIEIPMFTWMGIAYIFVLICFLTSPISLFLKWMHWDETPLAIFVWVSGLVLSLHSIYRANSDEDVIVTEISLPNKRFPGLEHVKMVVLSDIHVSGLIKSKRMKSLVQKVNQIRPDLILITGDLVDGSVQQLKNEVEPLKKLISAHGVLYITGNHEYYSGARRWKEYLASEFGWKVLSNESIKLEVRGVPFLFLGLEDRSWLSMNKLNKHDDPRLKLAMSNVTEEEIKSHVTILLAHQPKDFYHTKSVPGIDLQISGHTHSGQFWPLYLLVKNDQTYNAGLYEMGGGQLIYVNQGTGFWGPPMRLGTRCEISTLIFSSQRKELV